MQGDADKPPVLESDDRLRALFVKRGELRVSLSSRDVELLLKAIDVMADGVRKAYAREEDRPGFAETLAAHVGDLEGLRRNLVSHAGRQLPGWSPGSSERGLLRSVLADITGYQRGDLTPALRDLREMLSAH